MKIRKAKQYVEKAVVWVICRICTSFQDALAVKRFVGFAQGVMELWGL